MRFVDQYRTQTILALFHVGTISIGSIGIGLIMKAFGYTDEMEISWLLVFVRSWGFMLMLIPVFWVLSTIWMELHYSWHSRRVTLVSGILLWATLLWFFSHLALRASSIMSHVGYD